MSRFKSVIVMYKNDNKSKTLGNYLKNKVDYNMNLSKQNKRIFSHLCCKLCYNSVVLNILCFLNV